MEATLEFEAIVKQLKNNKLNDASLWSTKLIDYFFSDTEKGSAKSTNFIKASHTLDNCVKLFCIRVDNAEDAANRLVSNLAGNMPKQRAKKTTRKSSKTIEENPERLLATCLEEAYPDFLLPNLRSLGKQSGHFALVLSNSTTLDNGLTHIANDILSSEAKVLERPSFDPLRKYINALYFSRTLPISPLLSKYASERRFSVNEIPVYAPADETMRTVVYDDTMLDVEEHDVLADEPECCEQELQLVSALDNGVANPCSYFDHSLLKNWNGPEFWKPVVKSVPRSNKKREPKVALELSEPGDASWRKLLEPSNNTTVSLETLVANSGATLLPHDYRYSVNDLCALFYDQDFLFYDYGRSAFFSRSSTVENREAFDEEVPLVTTTEEANLTGDMTFVHNPLRTMENGLREAYSSAGSCVDIVKLKERIWSSCSSKQSCRLSEIVTNLYPEADTKKSKRVCLVSLLHLANEKKLSLSSNGSEIIVSQG